MHQEKFLHYYYYKRMYSGSGVSGFLRKNGQDAYEPVRQ